LAYSSPDSGRIGDGDHAQQAGVGIYQRDEADQRSTLVSSIVKLAQESCDFSRMFKLG
jgi:hypothetical protein